MNSNVERIFASPPPGEEVVITGVAGRFPESENVGELRDNLFNKKNLVTNDDRRWTFSHHEIPKISGKLVNIDRFDCGYFGVHYRQAVTMDPALRILLESTIEAIMDAGYHPTELEGTKTGVYVGATISETEQTFFREQLKEQHYAITGLTKSMLAHRISYFLKLQGPSHAVDTACSSFLQCLNTAYRSIRSGQINAALVAGVHLCLNPFLAQQFVRLGISSKRGLCSPFDINADGYIRSETIGVLFLQKSKDSRRLYAQLLHCKANSDGSKSEGLMFPSHEQQTVLFREVFEESMINPTDITYLEAHGTGTVVGDPEEAKAIDAVFSKHRTTPLLIGSVKSNAGHSEPASGAISIIKIILAMENGSIPPNINFTQIRPGIEALESGRLKVVTEKTPLPNNNGLFGVNNFGFGGANCQAIFKWNTKTKYNRKPLEDDLPRLVCVSGRTQQAVSTILDSLDKYKMDREYIRLYHQVFSKNFDNHSYRGYTILTENMEIQRSVYNYRGLKRPLYVIFSDFHYKWTNIYEDLKKIPSFTQSLQSVDNVLIAKRLTLNDLIRNSKTEGMNLCFNQIIGNLVIQICFADILKMLDIQPEGTLGFGLGEFVCGYFENCLTLEETINCVYEIALSVSNTTDTTVASFIGLAKEELPDLPNGINMTGTYSQGVTIAGDQDKLENFVDSLKTRGSLYRKLDFCSIHFQNSHYQSKLVRSLSQILAKPKTRPSRWLSSADDHKFASAEFFLESSSKAFILPKILQNLSRHSIIFEIGNAQLVDSTSKLATINFEKLPSKNGSVLLLENLGSLYNSGYNMDLAKIYPTVEYPVSRSTPMIAPYIKWDHSKVWHVEKQEPKHFFDTGEEHIEIDINSKDYSFIADYTLDGENLFPPTGYLYLVWEALAKQLNNDLNDTRVIFKNCRFLKTTSTSKEQILELTVMLKSTFGYFEVLEKDSLIASGQVFITNEIEEHQVNFAKTVPQEDSQTYLKLTTKDIYKELKLRGYNYSGDFCNVVEYSNDASCGKIRWISNWVTFMDNMLQVGFLQTDTRRLSIPVAIKHLSIDAPAHLRYVQKATENAEIPVQIYKESGVIKSGGIELRGIMNKIIDRKSALIEPVLEKYQFIPLEADLNERDAVYTNIQLALENTPTDKMKIIELFEDGIGNQPLAPIIFEALCDVPVVYPDIIVYTKRPLNICNVRIKHGTFTSEKNSYLIVGTKLLSRPAEFSRVISLLRNDGYLLSRELLDFYPLELQHSEISIMTIYTTAKEKLVLCRRFKPKLKVPVTLNVDDIETFAWLPKLQELVRNNEEVFIYSQNQPKNGILGLVNCIHRELSSINVRAVLINDPRAPLFDINKHFYGEQLDKQLAINIYQNGKWGTYRHLKIDELEEMECEHCIADTLTKSDWSSVRWIQGPLKSSTTVGSDEELVHVYYASVIASGRAHSEEFPQTFEFVGRNSAGQRVMSFGGQEALSNLFVANKHMLWSVPDQWTMEEAVTVPIAYATVIFAIFMRTSLKPGNSILIHSGAGGVGQAAISLCLHYGCEVFTTVGTQEKREFLKKRFPKLSDNVIGNSRDTSFEQMIYRETNGRGVDIVLNSLSEEKLLASVRCLAHGGQFLEIGKFDCENDNLVQLLLMEKEATFNGVILDHVLLSNPAFKMELNQLIHQGIANGSIQPLTRTVFDKQDVAKAFKFMASDEHIGKVLIKIRDEEEQRAVKPIPMPLKGLPRYRFDTKKTAIILGGLGGLGLELANLLVIRGTKKLVLTSRVGIRTGYQASRVRIWKSYGVEVLISTADITTKSGCEQLIEEATQLGPVQSIFNLAVILQDAILENQTKASFKNAFAPKAYATCYLDEITREKCAELRDFVVFSSVTCGHGNGGQTNYGMANSVIERICKKRREDGYPALVVEWGAVGDVGILVEMQTDAKILEVAGTAQQPIASCLNVLETFLIQNHPTVSSIVVAAKQDISAAGDQIVETVAKIMGIKDLKTVSLHSTLTELGMDSMNCIEIEQILERNFQINLNRQEIRSTTFAKLYELQHEQSTNN